MLCGALSSDVCGLLLVFAAVLETIAFAIHLKNVDMMG